MKKSVGLLVFLGLLIGIRTFSAPPNVTTDALETKAKRFIFVGLPTNLDDSWPGCFVIGVRDDHPPIVALGFLPIFGCSHGGNFTKKVLTPLE
jgi:hypothetical protein